MAAAGGISRPLEINFVLFGRRFDNLLLLLVDSIHASTTYMVLLSRLNHRLILLAGGRQKSSFTRFAEKSIAAHQNKHRFAAAPDSAQVASLQVCRPGSQTADSCLLQGPTRKHAPLVGMPTVHEPYMYCSRACNRAWIVSVYGNYTYTFFEPCIEHFG